MWAMPPLAANPVVGQDKPLLLANAVDGTVEPMVLSAPPLGRSGILVVVGREF